MLRFPTWKVVSVLMVCVLGVAFSLPNLFPRAEMERMPDWLPHQQINLGLDLQGGSHLLLEVDLAAVIEERLNSVLDDVRTTLRPERIGYRGLGIHGDAVALTLTDPTTTERAVELLDGLNTNPVANELEITDAGNGRLELRLTESAANDLRNTAVQQAVEIVPRRIDEVGTREPTI